MHFYFNLFNKFIPGYGLMITVGMIISNLIAIKIIKSNNLNFKYFILLEAYGLLGAGIGAKILYLIISYHQIDWHRLNELPYINSLLQSGFVFFGGLLGALLSVIFFSYLHHIDYKSYLQKTTFLIPLTHAFGRIGCFMAGCCYGIPYNGFGHVVFPSNSLAPSNVPLFPIQLLESFCLFLLALLLYYLSKHSNCNSVITYLLLYSIIRFFLEFLRYDSQRGHVLIFSISQWISIFLIISTLLYTLIKHLLSRKNKLRPK